MGICMGKTRIREGIKLIVCQEVGNNFLNKLFVSLPQPWIILDRLRKQKPTTIDVIKRLASSCLVCVSNVGV